MENHYWCIYSVAMFHVGAKSALLLLSKPDPLALGSGLVLGADLKAGIYTVGIHHVGASNMTLAPIFFMPAHEIQLPLSSREPCLNDSAASDFIYRLRRSFPVF